MDDIERSSPVQRIQPVRKIRSRILNRERRELMNPYARNQRGQTSKWKKLGIRLTVPLTIDVRTPEEIEQNFIDCKTDLKNRLTFDRAQILREEPSSD
jgi:hypothetical protein